MPRTKKTATPRSHRREGSRLVTIWLTEEERARMLDAARRAGLALGPWLRVTCLRASTPARPPT